MTLQFKWTMSLCWLRYDLRSVYISVSFDRFRFNFDLRLDYQECCGCQPETQYRVNTKDGPLFCFIGDFDLASYFHGFFEVHSVKKLLPKMMSPGQCEFNLTSNVSS